MTEMNFETRTWCVGRFLVDMPVEFEMEFTGTGIGESTSVEVVPLGVGSEEDLKRIVQDRIAALKTGVNEGGFDRRLVYERRTGNVNIIAHEVYFPGDPDFEDGLYDVEGYFSRDGHLFQVDASVLPKRESADLSDLLQVAEATYPRANDEIPNGKGFCVDRAFIKLPTADEMAGVLFSVPGTGTFGLQFSISEQNKALSVFGKGKWRTNAKSRQVAGYDGEELRSIDANLNMLGFRYAGGLNKRIGDPYVAIKVYLYKQGQVIDAPPYNVEELHAVWNQMLNSVRRR